MFIKKAQNLFIVPITAVVGFSQDLLPCNIDDLVKKKFIDYLGNLGVDHPGESSRIVATTIDNIVDKNAYLWKISSTPSSFKIKNDPINYK